MAPRGQFNRTFVVGLAGATIASLGLFALSLAGGEIRDEGRTKLKVTSDCVSSRPPIAGEEARNRLSCQGFRALAVVEDNDGLGVR